MNLNMRNTRLGEGGYNEDGTPIKPNQVEVSPGVIETVAQPKTPIAVLAALAVGAYLYFK